MEKGREGRTVNQDPPAAVGLKNPKSSFEVSGVCARAVRGRSREEMKTRRKAVAREERFRETGDIEIHRLDSLRFFETFESKESEREEGERERKREGERKGKRFKKTAEVFGLDPLPKRRRRRAQISRGI